MILNDLLQKAAAKPFALTHSERVFLLSLTDAEDLRELCRAANAVKSRYIGHTVSLRGLIEIGNVCAKNCLYCGIRRENARTERFQMDDDVIVERAVQAQCLRLGSIAIQSGEIESPAHTERIENLIRKIHAATNGELGITLSLGEQDDETFRRWKNAGATRYLLRIETSDPKLYAQIHPQDGKHDFARRARCLDVLHDLNYQTGSGVMIGLPGQTVESLANDIEFFHQKDLDMIGMGPWIPHPDTPLGRDFPDTPEFRTAQLLMGVKMIAVTRLYLHDVNIAATTALQTLASDGREQGILAGANVIMPNITDTNYRKNYQLYRCKPATDEICAESRSQLEKSLAKIGETINWGQHGDSKHFFGRI